MKIEKIQLGHYQALRIHIADKILDYIPERAQIIRYASINKPDILWGNPEAIYQPEQAIRSGIPLCWPWFGQLTSNPTDVQKMHNPTYSAASHGFARCVQWKNHTIETLEQEIIITNSLHTSPLITPQWPHEAELKITIRFNKNLHIQLQINNYTHHNLAITQALHSYFLVSDIRHIHIHGLQGLSYLEQDNHGHNQINLQKDPPTLTTQTDRIYTNTPKELSIEDPTWQRKIIIQAPLSHSAVLWTPWQQQAQTLNQFPASLWNQIVCLEIGCLLGKMQIVPAKESRNIDMFISIIEDT